VNLKNMKLGQEMIVGEEETFLPDKMVMVDLEMTGVVPGRDKILQIAMLKLELQNLQYVEVAKPLVIYMKYDGKPENDFQKKFLAHIIEKCNQSDVVPEMAAKQIAEWMGDWTGKCIPVGDCVITDLNFLYADNLIKHNDIVNDEQVPGTFHYEIFDLNGVKCIARQKAGSKFDKELPLDENIHDALPDCRNQTLELNAFIKKLLE
jgi:oligoribonuclease (3'-5' exoribonuclease)